MDICMQKQDILFTVYLAIKLTHKLILVCLTLLLRGGFRYKIFIAAGSYFLKQEQIK